MQTTFRTLLAADCATLTPLQLDLCAADLVELFTTEADDVKTLPYAYEEWVYRLGGEDNIATYAAGLEAAARQREAHTRNRR